MLFRSRLAFRPLRRNRSRGESTYSVRRLRQLLTRPELRAWPKGKNLNYLLKTLWSNEQGQDIAEYAVMMAVVLVIVVGTVRLIGLNSGNVFSQVGSTIQ